MKPIIELNPATYVRHAIHGEGRMWAETNCYVDVLVELIHALGFDPVADLSFTLSVDFEADQWTFFKYPPGDLLALYGLDIQELNPWKNLVEHVANQVHRGRPVLVELDSFFLPDTAGSAYKIAHVKSTVAVNEIDIDREFMGYFHGQGYYSLEGDDFRQIFQLDGLVHDRMLPPYVELVKLHKTPAQIDPKETLALSKAFLKRQIALMPETNPFETFKVCFEKDLEWLMQSDLDAFHKYSFATLRQYGACFELSKTYIDWLTAKGETDLSDVSCRLGAISETSKTFQFQLARAMMRKKTLDLSPIDQMGEHWANVRDTLTKKYLQ